MPPIRARCFLFALALTVGFAQGAPLAFRWSPEVTRAEPYDAQAFHGETFAFVATPRQYGQPLTGLTGATAKLYWQTPGMEPTQWYTAPGAYDPVTGALSATWTPAMDVGGERVTFFLALTQGDAVAYRIYGRLRLAASPGFNPAELVPEDVRQELIDAITADVKGWADGRYLTAETDPLWTAARGDYLTKALAAATYQPKGDYLTAEADPTVPAWAKAAAKPAYGMDEIAGLSAALAAKADTSALEGYLPLSGGTVTGDTTIMGTRFSNNGWLFASNIAEGGIWLSAKYSPKLTAGNNVTLTPLSDGSVKIDTAVETYKLPVADAMTLGGVKAGNVWGKSIDIAADGTLSTKLRSYAALNGFGFEFDANTSLEFNNFTESSGFGRPDGCVEITESYYGVSQTKILATKDYVDSQVWPAYELPPATKTTLGGIKVGSGLAVTTDGTLSATAGLPEYKEGDPVIFGHGAGSAEKSVAIGDNANANGNDSVALGKDAFVSGNNGTAIGAAALANANEIALRGGTSALKVDGTGLTVNGIKIESGSYTLPVSSLATLGGVKVTRGEIPGDMPLHGLRVEEDGTLKVWAAGGLHISDTTGSIEINVGEGFVPFVGSEHETLKLAPATKTALGGIKVGSGLAVTTDGTLSSTGGDTLKDREDSSRAAWVSGGILYYGTPTTATDEAFIPFDFLNRIGNAIGEGAWNDDEGYLPFSRPLEAGPGIVATNNVVNVAGRPMSDRTLVTLAPATAYALGGVKVGGSLKAENFTTIDVDGFINVRISEGLAPGGPMGQYIVIDTAWLDNYAAEKGWVTAEAWMAVTNRLAILEAKVQEAQP